MLERCLHTARFPIQKFPLSRPPDNLHWGSGPDDSFLFLGNTPAVVHLPVRLNSLDTHKNGSGNREILLEAEMFDDAYYFGMNELFNLTGDNPSTSSFLSPGCSLIIPHTAMDPIFYAYRNTGSNRPVCSVTNSTLSLRFVQVQEMLGTGGLNRRRTLHPSRFHQGNVVLFECSVRPVGSTYVSWYSFFSLRAISLLYRSSRS